MSAQRETVAAEMPHRQQNQTVLWVIALLLAVIATAMVVRTDLPFGARQAYGDSPMMGARGIFAFTGQIDRNSHGLFMMDVDNSTIWCYQYVPSMRKLQLVAARSYMYDRYLENYNFGGPTLEQTKRLLEQERQNKNRTSRGGIGPDTEPLEASDLTTELATQPPAKLPIDPAIESTGPASDDE